MEPYNLRPSYWMFLHKMSNGRYEQFVHIAKAHKPEFLEKTGFLYEKEKRALGYGKNHKHRH